MNKLAKRPQAAITQNLAETARAYFEAALSANTRRAYKAAWRSFEVWARKGRFPSMPAQSGAVALYLAARAQAGRRVSSLQTAMAAIAKAHEAGKFPNPCDSIEVRTVAKGIRRTIGVAPLTQKQPVLIPVLRTMLGRLGGNKRRDMRDRAILLLGFSGAFRRSELAALTSGDLEFDGDGLRVTIRRSKTDQEGLGRTIAIPFGEHPETCPVRAVQDWYATHGKGEGRLFGIGGRSIALIIKRHVTRAGLDATRFAGHSLRAGLATAAAKAGKSERAIAAQTGHRSMTVLRGYIRGANLFEDNAAKGIGL